MLVRRLQRSLLRFDFFICLLGIAAISSVFLIWASRNEDSLLWDPVSGIQVASGHLVGWCDDALC